MNNNLFGKKVLLITPSFPMPESGAEQSDRANGIRQLKRLGCEVVVVAKVVPWADTAYIAGQSMLMGVRTVTVPYRSLSAKTFLEKFFLHIGRLRHMLYLDGACYEYADPAMIKAVEVELRDWKPDVVWFDYTYLWPLYPLVRRYRVPIITRSVNYEPEHFLEEDGMGIVNFIKFQVKKLVENAVTRMSDIVLAISPKEKCIYSDLGAKYVEVLPLRGIYKFLEMPRTEYMSEKINVVFSGSSYNVAHNLAAARMLITQIAPLAQERYDDVFRFHITGGKLPESLVGSLAGNTQYHGYVEHLDALYSQMHIALVPSLFGCGMQQKIFEPLCRGLAVVTSQRGLADYPFKNGEHLLTASTPEEYVEMLGALIDPSRRASIAKAGRTLAVELFSKEKIDNVVSCALECVLGISDTQ